ncbi:MAG: hypothetical protein A2201_11005 [Alicyclobacillus sp. RIFOXYA1_FULL_53_8]|nr:MAG: hypothetical protein A2201_11005 [Alicyclobacillus sp. RIFOXYA1_FULL_53_8]
MARHPDLPDIGSMVEVLRGRDKGLFGIVVGFDGNRFLLIADGDKRKAERPKKKNALHVRKLPYTASDVVEALKVDGKVTNARLRYAVRQFDEMRQGMTTVATEEGGARNG